MRPKFLALAFYCATALLLSGCNTAAVRVLTNYETFSKLDPKVRANILRGRPNYSSSAASARAGREVWSYTGLDVTKPISFDSNQSGYANARPTIFLGSVTFRDGKVIEFTNSFAAR